MMVLSQAPGGALSTRRCATTSSIQFTLRKPPLFPQFAQPSRNSLSDHHRRRLCLTLSKAEGGGIDATTSATTPPVIEEPTPRPSPPPAALGSTDTVFVGQQNVPLEGVIQFEKPSSASTSRIEKWGRVALLAGGDVVSLLIFSAIGRFSHGFPVFDMETLRTADPFVAGWFLGAYFLGGYGEDGRGMNGTSKAVVAAAKSWAVGIPLGIVIRTAASGHVPATAFMLVTMGSTGVLLTGWRALASSILPKKDSKKDDVYRRGNPFELFELLTSLVRRW
ncbi:unnamed protein product [Linum trigynum]|uniref:Transmembrane protein n=1 Tax=Linum trigynum TaxID=586398 RepID=A0AAV2FCK1_9ROSI